MSRRSKRQHRIIDQAQAARSPAAVPPSDSIERATPPQHIQREAFRALFQKAVAIVTKQLNATGRIDPTALFVYGNNVTDAEESATTVVSIAWKNEFHKEAVRTRLREKAKMENAFALILILPEHARKPHEGQCVLSGAAPQLRADASLTYALDRETQTFILSELTWHEEPRCSFFLEGLFTEPE